MTSPIGKLLLQYTKLPLDVIQYCIEPCFGVTEEEVRKNRKKLIFELEWVLHFDNHIRTTIDGYSKLPQYRCILLEPKARAFWVRNVESTHFLEMPDFESALKFQRIKHYNKFVASQPFPRVEKRPVKPKSLMKRCLAWMGIFVSRYDDRIKVNLKTREVVLYRYH